MSFRGAKRLEIPQDHVCKTNSQGFLAPFVARNVIRTVNCVTPNHLPISGRPGMFVAPIDFCYNSAVIPCTINF